ncbi:MAG: hypothetical protein HGB06_12630 [Chlorobaculum sp.]|jgi:hypothetical protein|nr:hypothetical protein [Chlorobaculum sp.]
MHRELNEKMLPGKGTSCSSAALQISGKLFARPILASSLPQAPSVPTVPLLPTFKLSLFADEPYIMRGQQQLFFLMNRQTAEQR